MDVGVRTARVICSMLTRSIGNVARRSGPIAPIVAPPSGKSKVAMFQSSCSTLALLSTQPLTTTKSIRRHLSTSAACSGKLSHPITTDEEERRTDGVETDFETSRGHRNNQGGDEPSEELDFVFSPSLAVKIAIRPFKPEDCGAILNYLRAHAHFEGHSDEFDLTESDIIRNGFGHEPCFRCEVAEAHRRDGVTCIIGYALYSVTFCAWKGRTLMWENRYAHPLYRGYGIGKALFHVVCKTQIEQGCRRVSGYVDAASEPGLLRWYGDVGMEDLTHNYNFHLVSAVTEPGSVMARYARDGHRPSSKATPPRIPIVVA